MKIQLFLSAVFFFLASVFLQAQSCLPDGITFSTQAEIDGFSTNYPGCNSIEGDVIISGADITNLTGLSVISNIDGSLRIVENENLLSLNGLENIFYISDIVIESNNALTSLSGLDIYYAGTLLIKSNNALTSLNGLESLTNMVGGSPGGITIESNNALTSLSGLDGIAYIPILIIESNNALTSISDLNLYSVNTLLIKSNNALTSLNGLGPLVEIITVSGSSGGITIESNNALTSLSGLENLSHIPAFIIESNNALTSISDLSLSSVNRLLIKSNNALTSLSGFESLSNIVGVSGGVSIESNNALTSLEGLSGLSDLSLVGQHLKILSNNALTSLNGLSNLDSVYELRIAYNNTLTSLDGLDNLMGCEVLFLTSNNALTSLVALDGIDSLANIHITSNNSLASLNGLNNLTSVGIEFTIESNNALTTLAGLESLTSIGDEYPGGFSIAANNALISLEGLDNLSFVGGPIIIQNCASLSECEINSICQYIENGGEVLVNFNAPGCNSVSEIETACQASPIKDINSKVAKDIQIFPNPTRGIIHFSGIDDDEWNVVVRNSIGNLVWSQGLTGEGQMDVSSLPTGVYFIELENNRQTFVRRIIKE